MIQPIFKKYRFGITVLLILGVSLGSIFFTQAYRRKHAHDPHAGSDGMTIVDWSTLNRLDYKSGTAPDALKNLNGQLVHIPGFVVPLEDNYEEASEFLLVPDPGSCVHVPPPPPNQMVYVKMKPGKGLHIMGLPYWVTGRLKIDNVTSPYGTVAYALDGDEGLLFESWKQFEEKK